MNVGTRATARGEFDHLRTLADVVANFRERYKAGVDYDPVVAHARSAGDIREAIQRATAGRGADGKMFAMDRRIDPKAREVFTEALIDIRDDIRRAIDFEELFDLVEGGAPRRIGDLTIYNVSMRIGAYLGLVPIRYVYLHAGPLRGWKRLFGSKGNPPKRLPLASFPPELRELSPVLVEDLLCEYRDFLCPGLMK
jgi:hypothetical protein